MLVSLFSCMNSMKCKILSIDLQNGTKNPKSVNSNVHLLWSPNLHIPHSCTKIFSNTVDSTVFFVKHFESMYHASKKDYVSASMYHDSKKDYASESMYHDSTKGTTLLSLCTIAFQNKATTLLSLPPTT